MRRAGTLEETIWSGEKDRVAAYLARGGDPDATIPTDKLHADIEDSLLSVAIGSNQFEIARLLLDKGANPDGPSGDRQFPLWWAARSGDLGIVKELVTRGAKLDSQRGGNGTTALHAAIYSDHPEVVRYLVGRGADVEKRSAHITPRGTHWLTPLELARTLKHAECEQALGGK
jgi:ankyrin repeat protein